jgi:putative transposase
LAAFRARPKVSTLLPRSEGRKSGTCFIRPEIELIIDRAIQSFYLDRLKPPFSALVEMIQTDCHQAGFRAPDRKTILRRVAMLDQRMVMASRYGSKAAREKHAPVRKAPLITTAFEQLQIDHTPIDLIVVDEQNRQPLGRPWLTLAIDVASRMVCGFYLSMMPPSTVSVAVAFGPLCRPKGSLASRPRTELRMAGIRSS